MKVALLVFLALSASAVSADEALTRELMDFIHLLPSEKMMEVYTRYFENPQFVAIYDYILNSKEFKAIVIAVEQIPEFIDYLKFLDYSGLEVFDFLKALHDAIGLPSVTAPPMKVSSRHMNTVMHDLFEELRALLPKNEIKELYEQKMKTSTVFKTFVDRVTSEEATTLATNLAHNHKFVAIINMLKHRGVEVGEFFMMLGELYGFM